VLTASRNAQSPRGSIIAKGSNEGSSRKKHKVPQTFSLLYGLVMEGSVWETIWSPQKFLTERPARTAQGIRSLEILQHAGKLTRGTPSVARSVA
jgi:hypothetical protein